MKERDQQVIQISNIGHTLKGREVKIGDTVRIMINGSTRYIEIRKMNSSHLTGVVDDPYYGEPNDCGSSFPNGTIITFKYSHISEIPEWTKNTRKIIDKYINKDSIGRVITGIF